MSFYSSSLNFIKGMGQSKFRLWGADWQMLMKAKRSNERGVCVWSVCVCVCVGVCVCVRVCVYVGTLCVCMGTL